MPDFVLFLKKSAKIFAGSLFICTFVENLV